VKRRRLIDKQQCHHEIVACTMHVHRGEWHCLEVSELRGRYAPDPNRRGIVARAADRPDAAPESATPLMYSVPMKAANGRILERLPDPVCASLNDEAARRLIRLKADAEARARVDELARKGNEGELNLEERAEIDLP
jgi:hypothetical protein